MPTYLAEIIAAHRAAARDDRRDLDALITAAKGAPTPVPFAQALVGPELEVIAEVKRRSPSKGDLDVHLDPAAVATSYKEGGAACLSVLTDEAYFGGTAADLVAAKGATGLPTLRKDFTVSAADLCDARLMGADAVLLIVAALSDAELAEFSALGRALSLDVLVEVHDEGELQRALAIGATFIGVNQRNLATFEVDTSLAIKLAGLIPANVIAIAESGVRTSMDAAALAEAGFEAVLVGESLVRSSERSVTLRTLRGHRVGTRIANRARR